MPWIPIAESWVEPEFFGGSDVSMVGSEVVATAGSDVAWGFNFYDQFDTRAATIRVTASAYESLVEAQTPASLSGAGQQYVNAAGPSAWSPSPMEFPYGPGSGTQLLYAPAEDGEWASNETYVFLIEVWEDDPAPATDYNCACDDGLPTVTLEQMRQRLARRLGFAVQAAMGALPPGMADLLDDFVRSAHELLYRRYTVMRQERFFTWNLVAGQRFYDIDENDDECTRVLDPGKLRWVGISQGDGSWRPLVCGIDPTLYTTAVQGIPTHYEVRQCIELWPAPADATWQLRIKGAFGPAELTTGASVLTVDPEAVFLQALANAKAHYGQQDAGNYAAQATAYIRSRVAESHQTRRYVPGEKVPPPAVRPLRVP